MLSNMCLLALSKQYYTTLFDSSRIFKRSITDSCKLQLQASNNNKLSNIKTRLLALSKQYQTLFDSSKLSNIKRSKRLTAFNKKKKKSQTYHVVVAPRCRRRRRRRPSLKRSPQRAKRLSEGQYNRPSVLQKTKKQAILKRCQLFACFKQAKYQTL